MGALSLSPYQRVLQIPAARTALVLGFFVRLPSFSIGVLLTIHVVTTLGRTYAAAGLLVSVMTVAMGVSGPWRGKLLDRLGLRRVLGPSLAVSLVCWSIVPFVGYGVLLGLAGVASLFIVPNAVVRQVMIAAVPVDDRRSAISLDASVLELAFIIGPAIAVAASSLYGTRMVIFVLQVLGVLGGVALCVFNPPIREQCEEAPASSRRSWFRGGFASVLITAAAGTFILSTTDIGIVAAMRGFGQTSAVGIVLAFWGAGSLVGGLGYGALPRPVPAYALLAGLAVVSAPMALAGNAVTLSLTAFVAGVFCAPIITATLDQLTRTVPVANRGEAMGWHGSALTAGGALGAPVAGSIIDGAGWPWGFASAAATGLVVAIVVAVRARRKGRKIPRTWDGGYHSLPLEAQYKALEQVLLTARLR